MVRFLSKPRSDAPEFASWSPLLKPREKGKFASWRKPLLAAWVTVAFIWLTIYMGFRFYYINLQPSLAVFGVLVCLAELHIILHLYGMLYGLWPRNYQTWDEPNFNPRLRFNIFICVCGEPPEVIRETIKSALRTKEVYEQAVHPLHAPRVIVLNDGKVAKKDNWHEIEVICRELGAEHVARDIPGGFKAGNINNGLRQTMTDDPHNTLDIVFDSDFCPKPEFLLEISKPFWDDTIDFVQTPQRYKNENTWVAKAAAAHQIFFFDWICPAKGHDNALFLCGTNFAIRRAALDTIGGLDEKYITEDYATSLELHLHGKRGVFLGKVLALGMAPTSLKQYFTQQRRWSKGNFDVTRDYLKQLLFGPLTWKQKMHYLLSATYYLIGIRDLILMLAPLPFLYLNTSLIRPNSWAFILFIYAPLFTANTIMYLRMFRYPIKSLILDLVSFPVFTSAFFSAVFRQELGFVVTIKKYEKENPLSVYKPQMVVAVLLAFGLFYSYVLGRFNGFGSLINYWWAGFNAVFLTLGFYLLVVENSRWNVWEAAADSHTTFGTKLSDYLRGLRTQPARLAVPASAFCACVVLLGGWVSQSPRFRDDAFVPKPQMAVPHSTRGEIVSAVQPVKNAKVIALTFDDGPYPTYTQKVLDVLEAENVRASFYMIGSRVQKYPHLARAVNAAGHDIGNHSWSHEAKPKEPQVEVTKTNQVIEKTVGVSPTHFRPPMGILNNGMADHARKEKHAVTLWSCDPKDWEDKKADQIVAKVLKDAKPGGMILLHDGGSDRTETVKALPSIIRSLKKQGYRFVTVPELLRAGPIV